MDLLFAERIKMLEEQNTVKKCIVNVSLGKRYEKLQPRLIDSIKQNEDPTDIIAWMNVLPPESPKNLELPYLAYCAKPFAMKDAYLRGYDILLWVDSACVAVKHTVDLFAHIENKGYYIQDNGWNVGQWCSDACLETMKLSREDSFKIPELSSMVLGLDMRRQECKSFLDQWCFYASDGISFIAPHTNDVGPAFRDDCAYRGVGRVSDDNRVYGHRHDQTVASILAYRMGWERTPRPIFVDYNRDCLDERTIFVNKG